MSFIFIRPKKGLKVPRPMSKIFLRAEGEEVKKSSYWIRRIQDGDVEEVKKPKKEKPQESSKKKTKKKNEVKDQEVKS